MPVPTETALRGRARALLEAMTERERWIYALPPDTAARAVAPALAAMRQEEKDEAAGVTRWADEAGTTFVVFDAKDLDVVLVEARGAGAPEILGKLLDETGFYAQSQLLRTALDLASEEAPKALRTLAHMVVAWDTDWFDLFLLHLASPDPVVRHEAVAATATAALVARDAEPAVRLLEEALSREKFPKLADTMRETIELVRGATGGPVDASKLLADE